VCLIVAAATANNVRLVVANDPDADRLAAAEQVMKADGSGSGSFVSFSGKDVGTGVGSDVGRGAAYCASGCK
jgi:phosphomannomutase